jgi:hypothetical protein
MNTRFETVVLSGTMFGVVVFICLGYLHVVIKIIMFVGYKI